ncbi:MAG: DUF5777 family beta-barrel protein, partial [Cyclobacteriaceae bacterium]|nr:DUF5777 family beta-barrel protein [Cyclobacteriaceae bacterium]
MIRYFYFVFLLTLPYSVFSQDDMLELLEDEQASEQRNVNATFKGSRLINGHTVKTRAKGEMDFLISHRFGMLNSGLYELFGLDNSFIRLGLDYGITDDLDIGIGRSSVDKTYDGFIKYKALKQTSG